MRVNYLSTSNQKRVAAMSWCRLSTRTQKIEKVRRQYWNTLKANQKMFTIHAKLLCLLSGNNNDAEIRGNKIAQKKSKTHLIYLLLIEFRISLLIASG